MTTSDNLRQTAGLVFFSYGFRPFFLFGALWAALAMLVWIMMLSGALQLPIRLDPTSWHAHEFLFGYLGAVIAGFLLTAVPNWTHRPPIVGWPLAGLFAVWVAGRIMMAMSETMPAWWPAAVDLLFPILLAALILREIIAGKNWNNLVVIGLLAVFALANLVFHLEAAGGAFAAQGVGARLGVATALMMICLIGGRIIPAFTRNWLVKAGESDLPTAPMQRFDKLTLLATVITLLGWVILPASAVTGVALVAVGLLHLVRLIRWKGHRVASEPLLWVLHLGYAFVSLGAFCEAIAILYPDLLAVGAAQHLWMAGGFALMTLGVMTRATLGHTGRDLTGGAGSIAMFACVVGAVFCRIAAGAWPEVAGTLYVLSAVSWISAFAGFVVIHGAALVTPKPGG